MRRGNPIDLQGHGQQYRLLRHIGKGGFGDVYLAQATTQGGITRTVAIKLLKQSVAADDMLAKRLRDEARVLGMLDHRNIVRAEDLLVVDGRPALVMEYVPGANLDWLIHPRSNPAPLPPEILLEIAQQVADALNAAWSRPSQITGEPLKLLHRDIKPANIRVTSEGMVKVLDFGISRPQAIQREAQTQRMPPGSRHYAAPEMILGLPHGPQVDIYALGATVYEAIAREKLGMAQDRASAHSLFVEKHLEDLDLIAWGSRSNALRRMLASMLAHDMERRPTAMAIRKQCAEMRAAFTGIGLQHWAPQVIPNVVRICSHEADGPLSGVEVFSERELNTDATTQIDVRAAAARVQKSTAKAINPPDAPPFAPPSQPRRRWLVLAGVAAVALTAGLIWWFGTSSTTVRKWNPIPPSAKDVPVPEQPVVEPDSPEPTPAATPPPKASSSRPVETLEDPPPTVSAAPIEVIFVSHPMGIGVSINHIPIGTTPLRTPLAAGTYTLTFHGSKTSTQEIMVEAGGRTRWHFDQAMQSIR